MKWNHFTAAALLVGLLLGMNSVPLVPLALGIAVAGAFNYYNRKRNAGRLA
jgi:hypothetical protein